MSVTTTTCAQHYGEGCDYRYSQYVLYHEYQWRISARTATFKEYEWLKAYRALSGPCPPFKPRCS